MAIAKGGAKGREVQMDAPTRFTIGTDVGGTVYLRPAELDKASYMTISV